MNGYQMKAQGLQTETTNDGVFIIRIENVRRETVDTFCVMMRNFDNEGIALNRHNRSMLVLARHVYPTPYATQRIVNLAQTTPPHLIESQAIIVNDSVIARLVRMLVGKLDNKARQVVGVFFNEADGLHWLAERTRIINEQFSNKGVSKRGANSTPPS